MPELPELEILCRRLDERCRDQSLGRAEVASISALKTVDPPLGDLRGRRFTACERRGKYVCSHWDGLWLVLNLARAGWVRWVTAPSAAARRPTRGPLALRVVLESGEGFDVTEAGTEKRLAVWVVRSPDEIEGVATLGIEPFDPAFTTEWLGEALASEQGDLKHALARQSFIAGIGNAYSDEALHAAKLSPFKPATRCTPEEVARLRDAVLEVLTAAIERSSPLQMDELKDGKRSGMRVHARTGQTCAVCGDKIREVSFATRSLQYCPTCQTGGKVLADRRLSRLLK